jgi:hypothetical protein
MLVRQDLLHHDVEKAGPVRLIAWGVEREAADAQVADGQVFLVFQPCRNPSSSQTSPLSSPNWIRSSVGSFTQRWLWKS